MKKLVSILVLAAMLLASVIAIVPASAVEDDEFAYYETRRLWTDEIYAGIKALYEKDGANTLDWVPSVSPFTPSNVNFQNRFAGTRLRSITLPVNKTLNTDGEGNFIFTISTYKRDALTNSSPVKSWKIKINAEQYGLQANKSGIYKFVENIDLTSYNIVVAEDEVLAFLMNGDTFIPGYSGGAVGYFQSNFPDMMGFGAYTGKEQFTSNTWPNAVIFFDLTYDVAVSEGYAKIKELVDTVKDYEKDDFSAGFDTFKTALEAAQAKLDSADSTDDFSAEYTALDSAVKGLVAITEIDKTALAAAITSASAYENKASEYTADSYTVFTDALAAAKSVNADEDAKQSAVNNAQKALDDAVKALDKKGDISTLSAKVQSIQKDYDRDAYTAVSYKPLNDALREAEDLISANSESLNAIEALIKEIDAAVAGLKRKADFTALNELVTKYEGVSHTEYTKESVEALLAVIDKVKEKRKPAVSPNVSEEEGAALLDELKAAIDGLVPYAVYDGINERIAEVEAMDKSKYTEESWNKVKAAIDAIDDLRSDRYTTQPAADAALKALNDAVAALVLVGSEEADKGNNGEGNSTDAPTTNDTNKATEPEEKGCGGVIATTAVVMTSVLALGAAIVAKKKEN